MDTRFVTAALEGSVDLCDLSVAERLAFAHEIIAAETVARCPEHDYVPPRSFLLPPAIERMFKGPAL